MRQSFLLLRTAALAAAAALTLDAGSAFAEACGTDCTAKWTTTSCLQFTDICKTVTNWFEVGRCNAEREIACKTGITSCDVWRSGYSFQFHETRRLIQALNETGFIEDASDCHQTVDLGFENYDHASKAYQAYQYAFGAAKASSGGFDPASILVVEGTRHFLHCACTDSRFVPFAKRPQDDVYYFSGYRVDGKWWSGSSSSNDQQTAQNTVYSNLGRGNVLRHVAGHYSSRDFTTTEVICDEGSLWHTGTGSQSRTDAVEHAKNENWSKCLVKTRNGDHTSGKNDIFAISVLNGNRWHVAWGPATNQGNLWEEVRQGVGGSYQTWKTSQFSSVRQTRTEASCVVSSGGTGGLDVEDSIIYWTTGLGGNSLRSAVDEASRRGYQKCRFATVDIDFGEAGRMQR